MYLIKNYVGMLAKTNPNPHPKLTNPKPNPKYCCWCCYYCWANHDIMQWHSARKV